MADTKLVNRALSIDELAYSLGNISHDDKCKVEDYSDKQILDEAKYVLDCFVNGAQGHINHDAFCGHEGPEQRKWAVSQVAKLMRFIARFDPSADVGAPKQNLPILAANMRVRFGAHEYVLVSPAGPRLGWKVKRVPDGKGFRLGCARLKRCQLVG